MGFCTPQEHSLFLRQTPIFEQMLIDDGPVRSGNYHRPPRELSTYVDDYAAAVLGERE